MVAGLCGCTPPTSSGGFDSDDPSSRLYAVIRAGEAGDYSAIPNLIDELGSADQAVRMYAIKALTQITGRRYDYVPYAPIEERHAAINRWMTAYKSGALTGPNSAPVQANGGGE